MKSKVCNQCNSTFDRRVIIDGVKRDLKTRTICLNCKPFQTTQNLKEKNQKRCNCCNEIKNLSEFDRKDVKNNYYFYACRICRTKNRDNIKIQLIKYKGGKCKLCEYSKCIEALEFHHTDSSQKDFTISSKITSHKRLEELIKEVEKCDLLCANCHREVHYRQKQLAIIV